MKALHLVAVVNGPGEVAGRLLPLVERLKELSPDSRVTAVIAPCQFASGREGEVAGDCRAVDTVMTFRSFLWFHWRRSRNGTARAYRADGGARRTIVMRLGGDPWFSRVAGRILRAPVWSYGTSASGRRWVERFLVPNERARVKLVGLGVKPARVDVVGELVVDSVMLEGSNGGLLPAAKGSEPQVALMPGSRPFELEFMIPFYTKVAITALKRQPRIGFVMPIAPFVGRSFVASLAARSGLTLEDRGGRCTLVSSEGAACELVEGQQPSRLAPVDLAVTVPGTNTLQLAALGLPMLVVLPLNKGEDIPLEGLLGWVLPSGKWVGLPRRGLTLWLNRSIDHLALPNIIAGESVVPEIRGLLSPEQVAGPMLELLADEPRRASMAGRLREIAGPPGAAGRAATVLLDRARTGKGSCQCGS